MPQLSLYVDDATMETLRTSALAEGVSMSRYASGLIRDRARFGTWPQGYWEGVYGCLDDDTFVVDDSELDPSLDDTCDWFAEGVAHVPA